jgi:arylsulfatase A-like enzyme
MACVHIAKAAALALVLLGSCVPSDDPAVAPRAANAAERPPSVLLILTDDQRSDTLRAMPVVREQVAARGVRFARAYVTNPSCCPSRVSLLTGGYSHTTGVWANTGPHGGFASFDDTVTIATRLDDVGYRTGLFGKYLNGYDPASGYVPPGWDAWLAGAGEYYDDYALLDAGDGDDSVVEYGDDPSDYSTRVLTRAARGFLSSTPADTPFFAILSYHAPHPPATPDPRDADAFDNVAPHRPPSFDERDVSDKSRYVRRLDRLDRTDERALDAFREEQLRSLLAVDRGVGRLLAMLRTLGRLEDTMVVFTSDNGYQWGEHRWIGKGVPYEESIRVPLVIRFDPLVAEQGSRSGAFALGIDLAPTIGDVAGVAMPPMDGTSLVPLLLDPGASGHDGFVVEHAAETWRRPSFCAVRRGEWAFIRLYVDGAVQDVELYDLARDPFQLQNRAEDAAYAQTRSMLEDEADERCVPPPSG